MTGMTIAGTGRYAPGEPIPNAAMSRVMDTNDEWIRSRTGIRQRHFARDGEGATKLALPAARQAIEDAGLRPADIDYILFATMTPDFFFPGCGPLLGARLGIPGVPALDVRQQCAAIPYSLQVANGLIATGAAQNILLVGAEAHAGFMPWSDWDVLRGEANREVSTEAYARGTRHRGLTVLFGDGAGAMVLRKSNRPGSGFIGAEVHSDGNQCETLFTPGVGFRNVPYVSEAALQDDLHIPRMQGQTLFKSAVMKLSKVVRSLCETHQISTDEIDFVIAHQANQRINDAVRRQLKLSEHKVPSNISRYANTSSATIGILLDELRRDNVVTEGDLLCFLALGAGLNWGAALLRL